MPEKPGKGETVDRDGQHLLRRAAGPGPQQYWAGLNERLGVDLKLQMVRNADYMQKFATTIAGNDLPDMLQTARRRRCRTCRRCWRSGSPT